MTEDEHNIQVRRVPVEENIADAKARLQEIICKSSDLWDMAVKAAQDRNKEPMIYGGSFANNDMTITIPEKSAGSKIYIRFPNIAEEIDVDDFKKIPKWISVKNRLPEKITEGFKEYLLASYDPHRKAQHVGSSYWNGNNFEDHLGEELSFDDGYWMITHWMELPEVPEQSI